MPTFIPILFIMGLLWFPAYGQVNSTTKSNFPIYPITVVDEPPQFPGGMNELTDYLKKNLRYPKAARKARLEGQVVVNFVVSVEGHIQDVKYFNSLGLGTDEEAVRLIANMPDWLPGRKDGQAVYVRYNVPINFTLR